MNEIEEYRPLFDNIIIRHNNGVSYNQKSFTQVVVTEEELEIDNYLVKNMIINNNVVRENYDITIIDDNHIKLYRKLMKFRKPVQNLIKRAEQIEYQTKINKWEAKVCECIVDGEKTIYDDNITIKSLNEKKYAEERFLDVKIKIKIIDEGYKFIFHTNIKD